MDWTGYEICAMIDASNQRGTSKSWMTTRNIHLDNLRTFCTML